MTKALLKRLNHDLKEMKHEYIKVLPEEIHKAASLGDLSENAEYEAALDRQRLLQSKIRTLEKRIDEIAQVDTSRLPADRVGYGSIVELFDVDTEKDLSYQLVMSEDAEISRNRISVSSPIGKALMGKTVDEEVVINIPSGRKHYEITGITTYHNTEQDL